MRKLIGFVLAVVAIPFCAGAQSGGTDAPDITGTYALVSINGQPLPFTIDHDGVAITIRSGRFVINADKTCASSMTFVVASGQEMTRDVSATYTRDGSKLTMTWTGAGVTTGTADGKTFTFDNEGMALAYKK